MFDTEDASASSTEVEACGEAYRNHYIKVTGYNACYTKQTIGLLYGQRPKVEPGFRLDRTETNDRHIHYTMHSYGSEAPHGTGYQDTARVRARLI